MPSTTHDRPGTHDGSLEWRAGALWPSAGIALGVALAAGAVLSPDAAGRLFLGVAAMTLLAWSGLTMWRRPGLALVDGALVLHTVSGSRVVPTGEVVELRALGQSRLGLRSHVLRVEYRRPPGDTDLAVFTRSDLGADPRDVVDALRDAGLRR